MKRRGRPPLAKSPTKGFIFKAASALFHSNGYKKVSVEEICAKAGASKMSFYRHFPDKSSLAMLIIESFFEHEMIWADTLLEEKIPFDEKLNHLLKRRKENQSRLGTVFLEEFSQSKAEGQQQFWEKWKNRIDQTNVNFLRQGQSLGVISSQLTPEVFLYFIRKRNEWLLDPELKKISPNAKERFEIVNDFFYFGMKSKR